MIKPTKKPRQVKQNRVYLDIETDNGDLLDIGLVTEGGEYYCEQTWNQCLTRLDTLATDDQNIAIAHNGGKFDWLSLIEHCVKNKIEWHAIKGGSSIIVLVVGEWSFVDSLLVLSTGLDRLGQDFCGVGKIDGLDKTRMREERTRQPVRYYEYLKQDCVLLRDICHTFMTMMDVTEWPITAASFAFKIWKNRFLDVSIFSPKGDVDAFITQSYAGGRTELFAEAGHFGHVTTIDANSMYPTVMLQKYPIDKPIFASDGEKAFADGKEGFYHVKFDQYNRAAPPLLWDNEEGMTFIFKGEGVFARPELEMALEIGTHLEFGECITHTCMIDIFSEYIHKFYVMREQSQAGKSCGKILLNALYGKFAQRGEHSAMMSDGLELAAAKIGLLDGVPYKKATVIKIEELTPEIYNVVTQSIRPAPSRMMSIASYITSRARVSLYRMMLAAGDQLLYTDTDSVHFEGDLPDYAWCNIGDGLGGWKVEFEGEATYAGRKMYALHNDQSTQIKSKGVSRGTLTREDMDKIVMGERVAGTFEGVPSLLQVAKGQKACQFRKMTRRVRHGFDKIGDWNES